MIVNTANDWETSEKAGLVSIGSHALFVSTNGPVRRAAAPVVIFITGGGAPTELYVHLHSALAKYARNYFYDRAGYGRSGRPKTSQGDGHGGVGTHKMEVSSLRGHHLAQRIDVSSVLMPRDNTFVAPSPKGDNERHGPQIYAEDSASELRQLMQAINVKPPYVLVAHSYGGILARTYFALFPDDVAGLALLDTNSDLLQQCFSPIPSDAYNAVTKNVDQDALLNIRERTQMTDAEWDAAIVAILHTHPASADEATHQSGRQLGRQMQIDRQAMVDRPLLVTGSGITRDWRLILNEGVRLGYGSPEERSKAEWWMESVELYWNQAQMVQLSLSTNARYEHWEEGHYFPITLPERTAIAAKTLLDRAERWTFRVMPEKQS